jgi:hypothetical protein
VQLDLAIQSAHPEKSQMTPSTCDRQVSAVQLSLETYHTGNRRKELPRRGVLKSRNTIYQRGADDGGHKAKLGIVIAAATKC